MYNKIEKWLYTATINPWSVFFCALAVRVLLIILTPNKNGNIDLAIYMDGGQLVSNGVNPYNHQEATELRYALRTDTIARCEYVDETQERWDKYASSNLPLSLLFYGAIDSISSAQPFLYRFFFMLFDALLAVIIAKIIIRYWQLTQRWQYIALIGGLGILNPILLHWGAVIPEEKGLQILFMLTAFYFAREKKWAISAILLGMSVAFKGLGVFIAPLCLYEVTAQDKVPWKKGGYYVLLSAAATVIWFLPYMPEVFTMMQGRLSSNIDSTPQHGSIWVPVYLLSPQHWEIVRKAGIGLFIAIHLLIIYKKKLNMTLICCSALILFVDIMLNAGSIDRMNMGFLWVILIAGTLYPRHGIRMGLIYIVSGIVTRILSKWILPNSEFMDALFSIVMIVYYTSMLISLSRQSSKEIIQPDETKYSHSRA